MDSASGSTAPGAGSGGALFDPAEPRILQPQGEAKEREQRHEREESHCLD